MEIEGHDPRNKYKIVKGNEVGKYRVFRWTSPKWVPLPTSWNSAENRRTYDMIMYRAKEVIIEDKKNSAIRQAILKEEAEWRNFQPLFIN